VITAKPASASARPIRTPASYSRDSTGVRAEPKTLTAGPSSASAPKPSTNSDWMRSTRQGSLCTHSVSPRLSSSRWSVVPESTCPRRRITGPVCRSGHPRPSGRPSAAALAAAAASCHGSAPEGASWGSVASVIPAAYA
jgi:hypothetical protein